MRSVAPPAVALVLVGVSASAEPLFTEVTETHLPPGLAGPCMNAAAGDVDGDGDLDLALAMEFAPKVLLRNDGSGRFSDASGKLPRTVHDSEDVAFADFDAETVAAYDDADRARLMADAGIVRNRLKVDAAITNAAATVALRDEGGLAAFVEGFRPEVGPAPATTERLRSTRMAARAGTRNPRYGSTHS